VKLRAIAFLIALAAGSCAAHLAAQTAQSEADAANSLFQAGNFSEAEKTYSQLAEQHPKDEDALRQLGYIALLSNQLEAAQRWLEKAVTLEPDDSSAKVMLAQVFYRRDQFSQAASILNKLGTSYESMVKNYPMMNAAKLDSFRGQIPYQLHGKGQITALKFVKSEPLPVVTVRVNRSPEATFFIDTGGAELALDTDFARELGVKSVGSFQGTFSGGQHAEVLHGKVDSVTLGDWTLDNVPVVMMRLRQLSAGFGVKQLDGCIGTNVLYQFLATLDYPQNHLVLRRKTAKNLKEFEKAAGGGMVSVPIWMAGDHYIVGLGQVNNTPPALLFVDTGLAGAGVKLAESMIERADIKLEENEASKGAGGGGTLNIVPYTVRQVSFGNITEANVPGLYDGPFPWENSFGFYLDGMVGHEFFKPYAVTFDFDNMRILLQK
jgi:hypothetical protein